MLTLVYFYMYCTVHKIFREKKKMTKKRKKLPLLSYELEITPCALFCV